MRSMRCEVVRFHFDSISIRSNSIRLIRFRCVSDSERCDFDAMRCGPSQGGPGVVWENYLWKKQGVGGSVNIFFGKFYDFMKHIYGNFHRYMEITYGNFRNERVEISMQFRYDFDAISMRCCRWDFDAISM